MSASIPIHWLLQGSPWVEYRARRDLLGQPETDANVQSARQAMLKQPLIEQLIHELGNWPGEVLNSHKSASQHFHKLAFLADLGLTVQDPGMAEIVERVLEHPSEEGLPQLPMQISATHGGDGEKNWAWALCDAPLTTYALHKLGVDVSSATAWLTDLVRENGWPCAVSPTLGKFRGPGRKQDPCPFANLAMLKLLSAAAPNHPAAKTGAETLLHLWLESATQHPYIFYMGNDFRKLKAPFIWYDLLHVLEVLTRFPWLHSDPRLQDMLAVLHSKMDETGSFTAESVWTAWKDWDFAQKKAPSRGLTLLAWRILQRVQASAP